MIILAILTLILNLIGIGGSIFIIVSMFLNHDGNLVLYIPFVVSVVLTAFSLKGLNIMRNPVGVGQAGHKKYHQYKIFLLVNGILLSLIYIVGIVLNTQ